MSSKLYPISDKDLKALSDKSEDDTNSYSAINKSIISKMKSEAKNLVPVSDSDLKAMANKSEDDSNSYSKINKTIISKMKSLAPASDKDIKILKGE